MRIFSLLVMVGAVMLPGTQLLHLILRVDSASFWVAYAFSSRLVYYAGIISVVQRTHMGKKSVMGS